MKPVACWLYDNVMEGGIDRLGQVSGPCVSSAWGEGIFLSLRNAVIFHCLMSVFHFPILFFRGPRSVRGIFGLHNIFVKPDLRLKPSSVVIIFF